MEKIVNMNNYERDNVQFERKEQETESPKKGKYKTVKLLVGSLACGVLLGAGFSGTQYISQKITQQKEEKNVELVDENKKIEGATTTVENEGSISLVVENVMPSIVAIDTVINQDVETFWGETYSQASEGSGSGIIIGENKNELLIVTNNHVIAGDDVKVSVTFYDDKKAEATVKGADATSDLAVIAIDKNSLSEDTKGRIKIATLGDSNNTKVGEVAIAIGNALGSGQSVTVGYISAKDREVMMEDSSMTLLQTDAAINPGNSGGALLNSLGEVIGINSVKYASEEVEGMGYAIPISDAIPIINELMNREQLAVSEQGYLGVVGQNVTEENGSIYNMPEGIYVANVTKGSPADKAGMHVGNIIVRINDKKIATLEALQDTLTYTRKGTVVTITVMELEDGEYVEKNLEVTLGSKSELNSSNNGQSSKNIRE
ncbi:MAG: trypsin-like peptidase domain-containing protein [Lachnospiraceae bacterium]|nr:trypsin-like peptidase domain-containing protein [Lachnospiraceae bacterium]